MSDKPTPSAPGHFGAVVLIVVSLVSFGMGVREITTCEADVRARKHSPCHHVTGDAAVLSGISRMAIVAMIFVCGFSTLLQKSDDSTEKSLPSSERGQAIRRDLEVKPTRQT